MLILNFKKIVPQHLTEKSKTASLLKEMSLFLLKHAQDGSPWAIKYTEHDIITCRS